MEFDVIVSVDVDFVVAVSGGSLIVFAVLDVIIVFGVFGVFGVGDVNRVFIASTSAAVVTLPGAHKRAVFAIFYHR